MKLEDKIAIAKQNKDISNDEILKDIGETEHEIRVMLREMDGFRIIGDRLSRMRADARESGIKERKEFIEKLEAILEMREKGIIDKHGLIKEEFL